MRDGLRPGKREDVAQGNKQEQIVTKIRNSKSGAKEVRGWSVAERPRSQPMHPDQVHVAMAGTHPSWRVVWVRVL